MLRGSAAHRAAVKFPQRGICAIAVRHGVSPVLPRWIGEKHLAGQDLVSICGDPGAQGRGVAARLMSASFVDLANRTAKLCAKVPS
jgi:hypothetical protein